MCANADACFACAVLGAPPRVPHPYVPAIRSFRGGLGTHAVDDAHGEWSGSSLFPLRSPLPPSPPRLLSHRARPSRNPQRASLTSVRLLFARLLGNIAGRPGPERDAADGRTREGGGRDVAAVHAHRSGARRGGRAEGGARAARAHAARRAARRGRDALEARAKVQPGGARGGRGERMSVTLTPTLRYPVSTPHPHLGGAASKVRVKRPCVLRMNCTSILYATLCCHALLSQLIVLRTSFRGQFGTLSSLLGLAPGGHTELRGSITYQPVAHQPTSIARCARCPAPGWAAH